MNSAYQTSKIKANTVSRQLKAAGFQTVSDHSREGMRVRKSVLGRVHVCAQFNYDFRAIRLATEAAEELRALGYVVSQDLHWLCVTVN